MTTFFNDLYTEETRVLCFKPCVNEFITDHWNDDRFTIHIGKYELGNSFIIYDEVAKCSIIMTVFNYIIMEMKNIVAETPLMDLFVKLREESKVLGGQNVNVDQ